MENVIIINPHSCTREERAELIKHLNDNNWDFREKEQKEEF